MSRRLSRRALLQGIAATAVASSGCSRRTQGKVPLKFWAVGREGEVAADLLTGFEREHPDLDLEIQKLPWTAAHEKLLTAYAGETLPDVCQLGNTWVPEFAALNALSPLDEFQQSSTTVVQSDYFPGFFESNRVAKNLFGIPWYVDTRLLYYRRDLLSKAGFDSPPVTWDEWRRMLAGIKQIVGPDRYSVLLPINEFEPLLVLALQQPTEVLREGGRYGNFRSADFRRALSFYIEMFDREWAPRMSNTQISNVWDEFGNGFFSFYISGPWNISEFRKRLPPELRDAWMTAPMPGPNGPGASSAGGASLVIFESSPHKEAAWRLIEYLSRPEMQQRFYELTGDMPPRRSTWASSTLSQSPYAKAFHAQLDRVRSPPKVPEWERIAQEMRLAAERVIQKQASIEEAITALDAKTDGILEKRRWMLDKDGAE
ncbi:MAG: sugar ABC transporter substrate-binding protein [Povalibacter sp.]